MFITKYFEKLYNPLPYDNEKIQMLYYGLAHDGYKIEKSFMLFLLDPC